MALLLSPEQASSSTAVTPQWPAPTLHEPCLDEHFLGEREEEEEGISRSVFFFFFNYPFSVTVGFTDMLAHVMSHCFAYSPQFQLHYLNKVLFLSC